MYRQVLAKPTSGPFWPEPPETRAAKILRQSWLPTCRALRPQPSNRKLKSGTSSTNPTPNQPPVAKEHPTPLSSRAKAALREAKHPRSRRTPYTPPPSSAQQGVPTTDRFVKPGSLKSGSPEVRSPKSEVRSPKSEVRSPKSIPTPQRYNRQRDPVPTLRTILDEQVREADPNLYEKIENNRVRCFACGHCCPIPEGQPGKTRQSGSRSSPSSIARIWNVRRRCCTPMRSRSIRCAYVRRSRR